MARCSFCHREFKSSQSVRAHLRFCQVYQRTLRTPSAPPRARRATTEEEDLRRLFGPAVPSSRTHPASQDIEPRHAARRPTPAGDSGWSREQIRQEVRRQWQALEEEERQARATRIRAIVQEVKFLVVDLYSPWPPVPSAAIAEVKVALERDLPKHPILELPRMEVQQIGGAIRDKIYGPYQTPAVSIPALSSNLIAPTPNPLPNQEVTMPKRKVVSGYFECPLCEEEYELDRVPESEALCDACHIKLEEVDEEDDDAD